MTAYNKIVDYAAKDALLTGNPAKIVKGVEIGAEFDSIAAADATNIKTDGTHAATSKVTPVDADELPLVDSAASWGLKRLTWANLKATILTWLQGTVFPSPGAIGGTTPAAGSFTTLSATGTLSTTVGNNTGAFVANGATTGYQYIGINNTGNGLRAILESSVGGTAVPGSTAYATCFGSSSAYPVHLITNGSVAATLDASGNLGIGVTPSAWNSSFKALDVGSFASVACESSVTADILANTYYKVAVGFTYRNNGYASYIRQEAGAIKFNTAPSGTAGNAITFTQAMTLEASGNLFIGTTTDSGNGAAFLPIGSGSGMMLRIARALEGTAHQFAVNSNVVGSIYVTTTATTYNTSSDQRLKENITDAESASSLIDSIQVRQFDWKTDNSHQRYGMVAQELALVAPEAVHQPADPDDMMAVDYSKLVPMLVKEIQSLRGRLAALEANVAFRP